MVMPEVKQEGDLARLLEKTMAVFLEHPFHLNDAVLRINAKVTLTTTSAFSAKSGLSSLTSGFPC